MKRCDQSGDMEPHHDQMSRPKHLRLMTIGSFLFLARISHKALEKFGASVSPEYSNLLSAEIDRNLEKQPASAFLQSLKEIRASGLSQLVYRSLRLSFNPLCRFDTWVKLLCGG
ncbi:MAG: hypothetical protein AAF443_01815 [Chlamydiota bacterium]